ncbi:MAG: NADH-dependent [FeFe] hydrogenase, group A6 [Lachnospiraceae bacterium]|nr:NADH-dependent [FeFe] hydrogenase, group A6 [Lachnospiraceae bacterium]
MENIKLKINGIEVSAPKGSTILDAAHLAGVKIPTLCYFKEINEIGACRVCVVEVKGARNLVAACVHPATDGMEVLTATPQLIKSRKKTLELMLSAHDRRCLECVRSGNCEFQSMCQELGVEDSGFYDGDRPIHEIDTTAPHLIRDNNKCILCRRCTSICEQRQHVAVIGPNNRGFDTVIGSPFEMGLGDTSCIHCGQCVSVCPTAALQEKPYIDEVLAAIADPTKYVVVQPAPSVRTALGEEFGYPIGTDVEGKMAAALRRIGFDGVYDTCFGADLTIMEESEEFRKRLIDGVGKMPMFTSCSPGWVSFCEHYYPELIENLSSCKSPQQMFGAVAKTYYATEKKIDPKDIVSVSIMPCTAKKYEAGRDDQSAAGPGIPDVDYSITTRELARMIRKVGLDFRNLPDEKFDDIMGDSTGAGVIFGASGGVAEAALRTLVARLENKELKDVDFHAVRGMDGIKEATIHVAGKDVKIAVTSGMTNAKKILDQVRAGTSDYDFIEVMGCWGGCVAGGGQPHCDAETWNHTDVRGLRAKVLYDIDVKREYRKSHKNPSIIKLYDDYLVGGPGADKAHHILHTSYKKRKVNEFLD